MNLATLKTRLTDWYDRKIIAKWYKATSLLAGWLASAIVFLPDLFQFIVDRWEIFGPVIVPKLSPEARIALLGVVTTFVAPALRAWAQKSMQQAAIKQLAEADKVIPLPASGVAPPAAPKDLNDFSDGVLRRELLERELRAARQEGRLS